MGGSDAFNRMVYTRRRSVTAQPLTESLNRAASRRCQQETPISTQIPSFERGETKGTGQDGFPTPNLQNSGEGVCVIRRSEPDELSDA
jgi:hypothetical protein